MRVLLVVLASLLAACARPSSSAGKGEGLLVLSIDGLRADHLNAYGYARETAPTIAALAAEGLLFSEAYAASPRRLPSHAALLTGCDPLPVQRLVPEGVEESLLQDLAWSWSVPEPYPSLAVELLAHGWETAGFFDHQNLTPVRGYRRGFAHYTNTTEREQPSEPDQAGLHELSGRLMQWLRGVEPQRNWFAYVELNDLERSWSLPSPQWERYFRTTGQDATVPPVGNTNETFFSIPRSRWRGVPRSLDEHRAFYDGHVRRLDAEVRRLLGGLELEGVLEHTTIVIVGSYGVQFGEAGRILAGGGYSMADLHVPWIVRPSDALSARLLEQGTRVGGLASGIDLAPTLLELAGLPIPFAMHGVSQLPVLTGERESVRAECFASLGLLGGWVAIGPERVVESLQLDQGADASLVRSWGGSLEPGEPSFRSYDRSVERFPELAFEHALPDEPETQRLAAAAAAWFARLDDVREVLRGSWLDRQGLESLERTLEDEGWLQRAP